MLRQLFDRGADLRNGLALVHLAARFVAAAARRLVVGDHRHLRLTKQPKRFVHHRTPQ